MGRFVRGLVDGNGLYFSRMAGGDNWFFLSSQAVDERGRVPDAARAPAPYTLSPSANVRGQSRYILEQYGALLEDVGASFQSITQVEQYIQWKAHADGYLETSRGPGFLEVNRPSSALMETGEFIPDGTVVVPTAIGFIPGNGLTEKEIRSSGLSYARKYPEFGPSYAKEAPFSEVVLAGPYVFCTIWASDYETGVHPKVRLPDWIWWGNEIRNEAVWGVEALQKKLEAGDTSIDNVVHCTVLMLDISDLYELDLIWEEAFGDNPPARTVTPIRGLGAPRWEGARRHSENAMRMEIQVRSIRPGYGVEKRVFQKDDLQLGHEPRAVQTGNLLWISGQFAGNAGGLLTADDAGSQVDFIFQRLQSICEEAGTSLDQLLRLRAYVVNPRDGYAVYSGLRTYVPANPPCVCVTGVPGPLQVPGCTVMMDAVAYVP
jgi:enamine deaminase RidA (YjgF/YER057c/UK114 family)